jgi:hypothetical protein
MRIWKVLGHGALLAGLLLPVTASANQPQDWMLSAGKNGTYANIDAIFGAVQAGVENRTAIYGGANQLTLRASAIAAIPFGGVQADADLRILILTLGTSVGFQDVWHNMTFKPGEDISRKVRREREAAGDMNNEASGFWEARAGLALPFNDYVLLNSVTSFRLTSAATRTFDNLIGIVHDGNYLRSDIQLFFKHPDVGGIGPMVQLLNFPLDGVRHTQINYGLIYVSRAGLVRRDDLLLFEILYNAGDTLGGYNNRDVYGLATIRGPIAFTLAYRSVINL